MKKVKPWSCEIISADNGFVLVTEESDNEGRTRLSQQVFEVGESESGTLEAMRSLLYAVIEYFGLFGSKHDKYRLRVIIAGKDDDEPDK
jgi:hypothetical protein